MKRKRIVVEMDPKNVTRLNRLAKRRLTDVGTICRQIINASLDSLAAGESANGGPLFPAKREES